MVSLLFHKEDLCYKLPSPFKTFKKVTNRHSPLSTMSPFHSSTIPPTLSDKPNAICPSILLYVKNSSIHHSNFQKSDQQNPPIHIHPLPTLLPFHPFTPHIHRQAKCNMPLHFCQSWQKGIKMQPID